MDLSNIEVGFEYGEDDTAVRKEIVRNEIGRAHV